MALVFNLGIECGGNRAAAEAIGKHFTDAPWVLAGPDGELGPWNSLLYELDEANCWWVGIAPSGVSRSGPGDAEDVKQMTEAGFRLYEHLRSAPPIYRWALVGVEAAGAYPLDWAMGLLVTHNMHGLVLSEKVWTDYGRPSGFEPFSPGYVWIPYQGEG